MTNTADEGRANLLEKVTAYISKHTINDVTNDDEAFFHFFTKRIKCSVYRALHKIADCAEYYSSARNNYLNENPKFDQAVKDKATNIALKCFKKLKDKVIYTSSFNLSKQTISLFDSQCLKNCSCSFFCEIIVLFKCMI